MKRISEHPYETRSYEGILSEEAFLKGAQAQLDSCEKEHEAELYEIAKALGYPKEATQSPCNVLAHAVETLVANYTEHQKEYQKVVQEILDQFYWVLQIKPSTSIELVESLKSKYGVK